MVLGERFVHDTVHLQLLLVHANADNHWGDAAAGARLRVSLRHHRLPLGCPDLCHDCRKYWLDDHQHERVKSWLSEQNGRHQTVHELPQGRQGPRAKGDQVVWLSLVKQAVNGRTVCPRDAARQVKGKSKYFMNDGKDNHVLFTSGWDCNSCSLGDPKEGENIPRLRKGPSRWPSSKA